MGYYHVVSGMCLHLFLHTRFLKVVQLELHLRFNDYSCPGVPRGKAYIYLKDLTTFSRTESIM